MSAADASSAPSAEWSGPEYAPPPDSAQRGWWIFAHPGDVHCAVYHLVILFGYGLAFYLYLHPELIGVETWSERLAFCGGAALLLGWVTGTDIGVNYHNHVHRRIFKYAWLNRWFGRLWTFSGGWPAVLWKHAHVTVHHANVLEDNDWTLPKRRPDGSFENYWVYCLFHWPYRYYYHIAQDWYHNRGGRLRRELPKELVIHLALWSIPFWIDPLMALLLWVLPQAFANMSMGSGMYVQHVGCVKPSAEHPYRHSNDFLCKFFNLTYFNIGYHIEHHAFAQVHWCDLPALHEALKAHLDADGARQVHMGYFRAADLIGRGKGDWVKSAGPAQPAAETAIAS